MVRISRRRLMATAAGMAAVGAMTSRGWAAPAQPASPVTITVADVAGNLALTQPMFENYAAEKPDWVSGFTYSKAPAPELAARSRRSRTPAGSTSTWC